MKTVAILIVFFVVGIAFIWHEFPQHEHCIKIAASTFQNYATDHQGRFPYSSSGFGDALLLLVNRDGESDPFTIKVVTSVGDDGRYFWAGLTNGGHVAESNCSRIYIQGLTATNFGGIAILLDAYPTRGGDHFRAPWSPLIREVCFAAGDVQFIHELDWPNFSSNQIELLVKDGIPRARAEEYYRLASVKPWKF